MTAGRLRGRNRGRSIAAVVAGIATFWLLSGAVRADDVTVRAGLHKTYGRIVFDWPSPVAFTTARSDGRLVIRFERGLSASLQPILDHLGSYVRATTIEPDGRAVRLDLRRRFRLRTFTNDDDVVIDLLAPPKTAAAREPAPKSGAPPTVKPGTVLVRTGQHDTFGRSVFQWPSPVAYVALLQT